MEFGLETLALLSLAAFAAGFVDAIAGGGGLLTVPVLMLAGFDPVTAVATNKVQGTTSIISSLYTYHRAGLVEWRAGLPPAIAAFACGILGALSIHYLSREVLSALMPVLLIVVAAYFGLSRSMGDADSRRRMPYWLFVLVPIPLIAFYDGFLGPGAGSFYTLALVTLQGYGLRRATAGAKIGNGASNLGSLLLYSLTGAVVWSVGIAMGMSSILGAQVGSRLAVGLGARLIRPLIVLVCCAVAVKLLLDPSNQLRLFLVGG